MSSHHIIRDNQEPAVCIVDVDSHISEHYLGQLLEWSPTVIALASNLDWLHTRGIKVDILLCAAGHDEEAPQPHMQCVTYLGDFIPILFECLKRANNPAVYLVGFKPGVELLPYAAAFSINLLHGASRSIPVKRYSKWLTKGAVLRVSAVLSGELRNVKMIRSGTLMVLEDGLVDIPEQAAFFYITEEL